MAQWPGLTTMNRNGELPFLSEKGASAPHPTRHRPWETGKRPQVTLPGILALLHCVFKGLLPPPGTTLQGETDTCCDSNQGSEHTGPEKS
jgi:hypothetical protein